MRGRAVAIFVLLFQALWLNVIVPGHLRGIVQMPKAGGDCPACCCEQPKHGKPMTPQQQKNCAICFFAAHVSLPPVIHYDHAVLGLLLRVRPSESDDLFARIVLVPFDSCGPPAIA